MADQYSPHNPIHHSERGELGSPRAISRTMRWLPVLVLSLSIGCAGYLRPKRPKQEFKFSENVQFFSSGSGVRVYMLPAPGAKTARLDVRYSVGAAQDPPGKEGLAHLVEHLMFQTRVQRKGESVTLMSELSRLGLSLNAYTTADSTHFTTEVEPGLLDKAFALETKRLDLGCKTWDETTLNREREIVRNELREDHASMAGTLTKLLNENVYPVGHPYRRGVGGTDASIASLTLKDVCAFVAKHYQPHNASFFFVGAIKPAHVRQLVNPWLAGLPKRRWARQHHNIAPVSPGNAEMTMQALDVDQPRIYVTLPLPPTGSRSNRLIAIAHHPLRRHVARFARVYDWGSSVRVTTIGGARAPALVISARVHDASKFREALDAVWKSLEATKRDLMLSAGWLVRRRYYKQRLLAKHEATSNRGSMYADYVQFDDGRFFVSGRLRELGGIGPKMVRRELDKVFVRSMARVLFITPKKGVPRYRTGTLSYRPSAHRHDHWKIKIDVSDAHRSALIPAKLGRAAPVTRFTLANGLKVVFWPHGDSPLVYGRLVVSAGSRDDPRGRSGLAWLAGDIVGRDTTVFSELRLSSHADLLIKRLSQPLRKNSVVPLANWRKRRRRQLRTQSWVKHMRYERQFRQALYGADHPYAGGEVTLDSVNKIDGEGVAKFQRRYYVPANSTLIVAGRFDPKLLKQWVVYHFGHVSNGVHRSERPAPVPSPKSRLVLGATTAGSPVVDVDVGFVSSAQQSRAARLIVERILNAKLGALREELVVSYGMDAELINRDGMTAWRIGGKVDAKRVKQAVFAIRALLAKLRDDPSSYLGDFVFQRRKLVAELANQRTSSSAMMQRLVVTVQLGLDDRFFDTLANKVATVTPADIAKVIASDFAPGRCVLGLFGVKETLGSWQCD